MIQCFRTDDFLLPKQTIDPELPLECRDYGKDDACGGCNLNSLLQKRSGCLENPTLVEVVPRLEKLPHRREALVPVRMASKRPHRIASSGVAPVLAGVGGAEPRVVPAFPMVRRSARPAVDDRRVNVLSKVWHILPPLRGYGLTGSRPAFRPPTTSSM